MERLYRDRMSYVSGPKQDGCFICAAVEAGTGADEANLVLERADRVVVMLNLYPYNTGHVIVAPVRHVGELSDLSDDEMLGLMSSTARWVAAIRSAMNAEAFNVGMNLGSVAGAGLPDHLHVHVVPRWSGDTNFMPVLAESKVIPEPLEATYERLTRARSE